MLERNKPNVLSTLSSKSVLTKETLFHYQRDIVVLLSCW